MLIKRLTLAVVLGLTALCCQAQDSLLLRDYTFVKQGDSWLVGSNAAALTRYAYENIAKAELSLTKAKGGFTDFRDSPDVLQADAAVESFFRLSPNTVVFGAMSYNNFSGKEMAGSSFISDFSPLNSGLRNQTSDIRFLTSDFRHLPFDIVEDSLNNVGTKHLDTYHLIGAFGYRAVKGFAVGARLDYTAANYAKYKDLRHKNKLMDMTFSASVFAPLGSIAQIGASYIYRRTTESVQFSTYGKSDRTYKSFVNYGPFIGQVEQYGNIGYTDKSRAMPLVDDYNGLSAQLGLQLSPVSLYNAFTYAHRRGYYGRRSPYTITYTQHSSHVYGYTARLSFQSAMTRIRADLSLQAENLENDARNYRELKNDAGATYYQYYTPVKVANRLWVDGTAVLTADLSVKTLLPTWTLQAGLQWGHHKQTAYLFPYYRQQHYTSYEPFLSLTRNIATQHGVWTVQAGASFRHGDGTPADDGTFIDPSDKQTPPPTMDAYFWRDYQWMNAAQYEVDASGQYAFIMPSTSMKTYVRISVSHRKCNECNEYTAGPDRTTGSLTLGCEF